MAKPATSEMVTVAWLKTIPGITQAGTTLPEETSQWVDTGFVKVQAIAGSPGRHIPVREPLMALECYGINPGTLLPDWLTAVDLAEAVIRACEDNLSLNTPLVTRTGYRQARVVGAWPITDAERNEDDPASYGRFDLNVIVRWIEIPD